MSRPTEIDPAKYKNLLGEVLPVFIDSDQENRRIQLVSKELIKKGESRSAEQTLLLRTLFALISEYESRRYREAGPVTEPRELLQWLMDENGLTQKDLSPIPQSRISEILSGRRSVSKAQAQILADQFKVSAALFLGQAGTARESETSRRGFKRSRSSAISRAAGGKSRFSKRVKTPHSP